MAGQRAVADGVRMVFINMIIVHDNVLTTEEILSVRESAIVSGFGTWKPASATFGTGTYEGMNYKGNHALLHFKISAIMGRPIFPNQSFFRILTNTTEKRYIHSDRNEGSFTAITYLSDHEEVSGTAFFRHRITRLIEMPSIEEMKASGMVDFLGNEMVEGKDEVWEQTDFVRGNVGRTLIFSAPLFHGRFPLNGIGTTPENSRMIHVCHFEVSN